MGGIQKRLKQAKPVSGKPEGQQERKVIAISQLEQDNHGNKQTKKDGGGNYQVQRLSAHRWMVPELPGQRKSPSLDIVFPL